MTGAATRAEISTGAASAPASMQHPSASMEKPKGRPLPYGAGTIPLQRGRNATRATLGQGGMHPFIERQNSKHAPNGYFLVTGLLALAILGLSLLMLALFVAMIASFLFGATLFLRECVRHLERILGVSRGMRA